MPLHTRYIGRNYQSVNGLNQSGNGVIGTITGLLSKFGSSALRNKGVRKLGTSILNKGLDIATSKVQNKIGRSILRSVGKKYIKKALTAPKKTKKKKKKRGKVSVGNSIKKTYTQQRGGGFVYRKKRNLSKRGVNIKKNKRTRCGRKPNIFDIP